MTEHEGFIARGFARERIPAEKLGGATKVFFIVAGTLCGLPAYVLSARITHAIGFGDARRAFWTAGVICCVLAAIISYVGAKTRMNLAMMSDHAFGTIGGRIVKTALAVCLIGWAAVILSVLGVTLAAAMRQSLHVTVPEVLIEVIAAIAMALVTLRGVGGLESVGMLIAPTLVALLIWTIFRGCPSGAVAPIVGKTWSHGIEGAVSAVVGGDIVGILIQPDYARFVRRPSRAALASGLALGVAYPLVLIFTALPVARCGGSNLITVMAAVGIVGPALILLALGALIDGGASLYSGSLSLTNEIRRLRLPWVVVSAGALGLTLAILNAQKYYLPFLSTLGIALPPVGALIVLHMLRVWSGGQMDGATVPLVNIRVPAFLAWACGTIIGYLSISGRLHGTGIASVNSIIAAATVWLMNEMVGVGRARARQ